MSLPVQNLREIKEILNKMKQKHEFPVNYERPWSAYLLYIYFFF